jgi:pyruvate,water dikinase
MTDSLPRSLTPVADWTFEPPGPGLWDLDRSHYPGGTTSLSQWFMEGSATGIRRAFAEFGMPADTLDVRFVNGFMYSRLRPLINPDRPAKKLPPKAVLKLLVRLHPEMRRRAKSAARTLSERPWRKIAGDWETTIRPGLERRNASFAQVDVSELDDAALAAHVEQLLAYLRENFEQHFYLHTFDLGPIGLLLADCGRWGIEPEEVVPALAGASPSTSAASIALSDLRRLVAESGARPDTLDELRAMSPQVSAGLAEYLRQRGPMMVTRYDIDGYTLEEQPDVVLSTVLHGRDASSKEYGAEATAAELRARVPASEVAQFDERLREARASMDLRDDNGPNTVELPLGLLRRALIEAGRRLVKAGRIDNAEHVFELEPAEIASFVRTCSQPSAAGPTAATLAERATQRRHAATLVPPAHLGPHEPQPPLDVLSPAHQTLVGAVQSVLVHLGMTGDSVTPALHGAGVGTTSYTGRACVAHNPEEAMAALEPGDVLVVRFTTPAYNTVLMLAGAIVTTDGGLLSHAAVMARELGLPAVLGAKGAMRDIADGAAVEVDPVAGTVRVLTV